MKIGVIHSCFRTNVKEALRLAHELELSGVQIYATRGEFSPWVLTDEDIEEYKALLKSYNLEVSALCGDMGGFGFEVEEDNAEKVEKTCRIVDLAVKLGTKVITTHIGIIPDDKNDPQYDTMLRALKACGAYAYAHGVTLAIETGPEKASVLRPFLDSLHSTGVAVNLDPANLVMVSCDDAVQAVYTLKDYIVHTHAKDGRHYASLADVPVKPGQVATKPRLELPLGEGDVPFPAYLKVLDEIGYHGFLTIEREVGDTPEKDIRTAVDFLNRLIK